MSGSSRDTMSDGAELPHGAITLSSEEIAVEHDEDLDAFGDLGPGSKVGERYLLEHVLGKGATGVVFEASHVVIGKRVALKCLYPQHSTVRNAVARFFREAKIAATVEHPNVIQVFDGGRDGDVLFIAMERLDGESLGDRLDRGPLPIELAIELFLGIMDGVAAVHERGVVHRDLKPDNIFLAKDRSGTLTTPKVLDFGISKLKEPGRELTAMGMVMGTPYYMAPEQIASSRDVDVRADVYSLGVMLYEAFVGEVPYANDSVLDVFRRAQSGDQRPFELLRQEVPGPIARVVEKAMRPERDDRFATVVQMRDALSSATMSDTDPSDHEGADQRMTIRDVQSPLIAVRLEEAETPHAIEIARGPSGQPPGAKPASAQRFEERATVGLEQPVVIERAPRWIYAALGAAGVVTLASIAVAIAALLS